MKMKIWHQAQVVAGCNEHAWELCQNHRSLCGALLHSLCLQGAGAEGAAVVVPLLQVAVLAAGASAAPAVLCLCLL